ncbi:hypothetical protein HU47_25400 [Salmonella enterica subsp. enterica serovar Abaetetuba]|uniref:hypothetical protein n=1 Tax=Salmonella enterica TaxID=28901 RepID=UPI0008FC452F|nr:hypothetical protein [Salmonella enterica]EAC2150417.1 hypothetical protein [Salmonella enterica subsp. enterica]EAN3269528.1 hypothetical protein [Salmonella enterica subsp. enterica serovar Oranienburg]EAP4168956.1 hypothetical protein [Salmonella enterica subsp. enterica serovar Minnesota]EBV5808114.1 hypothetical protein [Salmonella enterica subsp. enterica serovar Abaetetuba]ECJ3904612.1 hypothetical protein [Salmonella enterica subsp. enterica serovar Poona]ECX5681312.1 hypothetical 
MSVPQERGGVTAPPYLLANIKEILMSDNVQDKDFDLAAFLLAGNIMVTLVEKGVIDMREASSVIQNT